MLVTETFHGYIETTQDVLLIFEGCRRGLLPRICRRLQERERKMIRSGSIFVFDERESGIKRWTDGRVWSPSRILGNFLIYRELDKKQAGEKRLSTSSNASLIENPLAAARRSFSIDGGGGASIDRNKERQLVGSLSDSYRFKEDGLIKKTMSIIVNGVAQHLISYYDPNEVLQEKLRAPSSVPELASLEISPELLVKQNFRIPPLVEPTFDQNDSQHQQQYPLEVSTSTGYASRSTTNMNSLRSMSVGNIRVQEQLVMYHHPYQHPNNHSNSRSDSPNTTNFQHSLSIPNIYNNDNTNNSTHPTTNGGFNLSATIPSPSPSTPMIPASRYQQQQHQQQQQQQQQHQRHYSTSSVSSRYNNFADSFIQRHNSVGHILANDTYQDQQQNERYASHNIGQLLNPVHPLQNGNSAAASHNTNTTPNSSSSPSPTAHTATNILQSINMDHPYDYATSVAGSSSLRHSISHDNDSNTLNEGSTTGAGSTAAANHDSGGGTGLSDMMNYYHRQTIANQHQQMPQFFMTSSQDPQQQQQQNQNGLYTNLHDSDNMGPLMLK